MKTTTMKTIRTPNLITVALVCALAVAAPTADNKKEKETEGNPQNGAGHPSPPL
jgi:hypothetical protein